MALLNFTANFSVLLTVLERIARALERSVGPEPEIETAPRKKRGPESIVQYGNEEREWAKEHFRSQIHEQGFPADREESLIRVAMKRWDYEMRHPNLSDEEPE